MAKMWAGRFSKEADAKLDSFNTSLPFDCRMYAQDIQGSLAHSEMLEKQGIISKEDKEAIHKGLKEILTDIESNELTFSSSYEDIHMFIEETLTNRIGDAGKRLHTARSRNDQVAVDMRLYVKKEIKEIEKLLLKFMNTLCIHAKENLDTFMPGYTHLQRAQPITLGHWMMAYANMFKRDIRRLENTYDLMDECPLGCGALATTTYPIDRNMTAELLGFKNPVDNSLDGVSDRDYCVELCSDLSILMMHLSRLSEEIISWCSLEFHYFELDDAYSTGSSIMPQKKNPDICELIRGKSGRVFGSLLSLLSMLKGLPLAYNKDMQEDKELTFDAIDTVKGCLALFTGMIDTMKFNKPVMEASAKNGFTNATDAADYLVNHGVPFRDAHGIIGQLVLLCIEKNIALDDLPLEEYKKISPVFEEDIYEAISMKTCVEKRNTIGAPGMEAMKQVIAANELYLKES